MILAQRQASWLGKEYLRPLNLDGGPGTWRMDDTRRNGPALLEHTGATSETKAKR
jgi:hypothetical protein